MTENTPALRNIGIPSEHEIMVYHTIAKQAVDSKFYKGIGDQSGIMMIMLAARELGIPAMQALNGGLNIISGKVEISARMMNALIRKAGHSITVKESNDKICTLEGKRCDNNDTATSSFSFEEATRAGLVKQGGGWTKFPKDMCFARALSRLARQLFSDVIGIGYVEGEIKAAEIEVISPKEPIVEEVIVENEEEWIKRYLELFEKDDQNFAFEYLKIVGEHFKWSRLQTLKEMLKDEKKLMEKFHTWKNKFKMEDK